MDLFDEMKQVAKNFRSGDYIEEDISCKETEECDPDALSVIAGPAMSTVKR